jgi:biotin carboxyl carrier protein
MKLIGPSGEGQYPARGGTYENGHVNMQEGCVEFALDGTSVWVWHDGLAVRFARPQGEGGALGREARAPMTGKVVSLPFAVGDAVAKGETVAILEAMKMEYRLESEVEGKIAEIGASEGDLVDLGQLLVRIE